jgi:hypothetical protein
VSVPPLSYETNEPSMAPRVLPPEPRLPPRAPAPAPATFGGATVAVTPEMGCLLGGMLGAAFFFVLSAMVVVALSYQGLL